jgi:hypothetical protein
MVTLYKSKEFIKRLERIDNPIAKYILDLQEVDETSKEYINYLGISTDNPTYISFLDNNKIERNKIEVKTVKKWYGDNCKVRLKKGAFKEYFHRGQWVKNYTNYLSKYDHDAPIRYHSSFAKNLFTCRMDVDNIPFHPDIPLKDLLPQNYEGSVIIIDGLSSNGTRVYVSKEALDHIEFVKVNEETIISNDLWNPTKRIKATSAKIRRVIGEKFDELFTHKDMDTFISSFRYEGCKECGDMGEFLYKELSGDLIKDAYHENNYVRPSNDSQLWNSCMRHVGCQSYFDIYTKNTNHVSLAVLKQDGRIAARSVLWYPDTKTNAVNKYFDRIYAYNDNAFNILRALLENRKYLDAYNGSRSIEITLSHGRDDIDYYPYMDTMRYISGNKLYNKDSHNHECELTETDGGLMYNDGDEDDDCEHCSRCGDSVESRDAYYIQRGRSRGDTLCGDCSVYCEDIDESVDERDAILDDYADHYIFKDNAVTLHNGNHCHEDDAIELHNEEYCHKSKDYSTDVNGINYLDNDIENYCVEYEGNWYPFSDRFVEEIDGTYYHIKSDAYLELMAAAE